MCRITRIGSACLRIGLLLLLAASAAAPAAPSPVLAQIKTRGALRCGVSEGVPGLSAKDAGGRWVGIDADFCRAVAAAALGDPEKVVFVPLKASARFPALMSRTIDLLARNTTWTYRREAGLGLNFVGVLFYDAQGIMVARKNAPKTLAGLKGATVCLEKGSTSATNLAAYSTRNGLDFKPLVIDSYSELQAAFFTGRCQAFSSDMTQLAATRLAAPGGVDAYVIRPERLSKEPLSPVVRNDDPAWATIVRWVLLGLVAAEENGITKRTVREVMNEQQARQVFDTEEAIGKELGIAPGWVLRAVESVGNYGEVFERNFGAGSPLKLERGLNELWTKGGLMYAPPMH
jgi:general L-amino acid transport system substrate-binding protein